MMLSGSLFADSETLELPNIVPSEPVTQPSEPQLESSEPPLNEVAENYEVTESDTADLSFWTRSRDWLILHRHNVSIGIDQMAVGIDRFSVGDDALEEENKTYARIRTSAQFIEGDGFGTVGEVKLRLSLPATQRKLHLVIESDADDDDSLEAKNRPSAVSEDSTDEDRFQAALQFFTREMSRWKTKAQLGIRAATPINPFVRHSASRRWDLSESWSSQFRQELAYYTQDGYRANEEIRFERRINDDWFYRMKTQIEWREEIDSLRTLQSFTFYNRIDDKRGVEYQLGILPQSLHHTVVETAYISIDYRQLLYEDWLYLDLIPELEFPREDDYDSVASFTARLEILFFD
ncbi:MAG: hypothetical protein MI976_07765 [Pseudomonadales bacterium]|nr:hypothetical protein [Pseudomonadales bacterium]